MEKVEVDPKLFVTCRLCLEDMGVYQIVPKIQEKIKYCFDIQVNPFDGMPQLICKKCDTNLTNYFLMKSLYIEKQKSLTNKLQNQKNYSNTLLIQNDADAKKDDSLLPQDSNKTDAIPTDLANSSPQQLEHKKLARRRRRIESCTDSENSVKSNTKKAKCAINTHSKRKSWKDEYNKRFGCRFCNTSYSKKNDLLNHFKNHRKQVKQYSSVINPFCYVKIRKIDNNPNFTGMPNAVVFDENKVILSDVNYEKYFIKYFSKKSLQNVSNRSNNRYIKTEADTYKSDSSDSDLMIPNISKRRMKTRRLLSTDTVVISKDEENPVISESEAKSELKASFGLKNVPISECIDIDSDTDETSEIELLNINTQQKCKDANNSDYQIMRNIIEVCHCKYLKKQSVSKTHLSRKIMSMGRKIINKQGLVCTGLLRFMEYKNLNIIWLPKARNKVMYHVRINVVKSKRDHRISDDDDVNWVQPSFNSSKLSVFNDIERILSQKSNHEHEVVVSNAITVDNSILQDVLKVPKVFPCSSTDERAILYKFNDSDGSSNSKLLNESPVPNPKKLPNKKTHYYDSRLNNSVIDKNTSNTTSEQNHETFSIELDDDDSINKDICMPVITSTTSLAFKNVNDKSENNSGVESRVENTQPSNVTNQVSQILPRIKVKPVSELMPEKNKPNEFLGETNCASNVWMHSINSATSDQVNVYNPNLLNQNQSIVQPLAVIELSNTTLENSSKPEQDKDNPDYVILDTTEMPNTVTTSPFQYLKRLMQMHGLILLDVVENYVNFLCLIKFKVLFKQDNINPIVLCLSLHCSVNKFYITVKDTTQIPIHIQQISANWQWEIIKIFQGDVTHKILQNAMKVSPDIHENTKTFLCLLKSINMVKT